KMEVVYQAHDTLERAIACAIQYNTAMFGMGRPFANNNQHTKPSRSGRTQRNYNYTQYNSSSSNNYNNNNSSNDNSNGRYVPMELDQVETPRRNFYNNNNNYRGNDKKQFKGNCYKCGLAGHYARDCRRKAKLANIEDEQQQQQQPPLVNNSLELTQVEGNQERLLRFK